MFTREIDFVSAVYYVIIGIPMVYDKKSAVLILKGCL
jgi:hypothetical protein